MNLLELRREIDAIRTGCPEDGGIDGVVKLFRDRYDEFDDAARQEADRILDGLIEIGAKGARNRLANMEDGPEKRSLARMIFRSEGTHVTAYDLITVLEQKTSQTAKVVEASNEPFVSALQLCCDFLFDARMEEPSSREAVVLHGLFMGLLDELLVAFHLAQRAFSAQAYSHLRTVEEVLDAIDTLLADSALFEAWLDSTAPRDERVVFRDIRQRVAQSLATDESRKLYAFLSALGPHPQFRSVQARMALARDQAGDKTATVYFLGSPHQVETANVLTVRAAVALAGHIAQAFSGALHIEHVGKELDRCRSRLGDLVGTYIHAVAEQMQLSPAEIGLVLAHRVEDVRR